MTLDELLARESIRKTITTYNAAGDRLKAEAFLSVFTEDAIYEIQDPAHPVRHDGLPAIRAWFQGWIDDAAQGTATHRASFIRHHLSTCDIELTGPDTATSRTYWTAYTDMGADHGGYYLDSFRKVGADWLIAHRRVRKDWASPGSLYVEG